MNHIQLAIAVLASTLSASVCATNFGTPVAAPKAAAPVAGASLVSTGTVAAGPQLGDSFRIVKPDGSTVIQQGTLGSSVLTGTPITISDKDAFLVSGGKCAFNVKYDEVSSLAATGTTNRLYSNDALIAQNTKIDLLPNVLKTIWTQPYLFPGVNNVRVVVNADSAAPSTKWIRITVSGTCGAVAAPVVTSPVITPVPVVKPVAPVIVPPKPVVISYAPGSAEWNNLNNMFGYSNYAKTQLANANYARYAELVKLNAAVTAAINAKTVEQGAYNSLVTSWNTFVTEERFKALMAAVVPGGDAKR
ncbi:MAG: hypothetical protein V4508_02015 [Pseudomonadota bacterium]